MDSKNGFMEVEASTEISQRKMERILMFSNSNFVTDFEVEVISKCSLTPRIINVNKCVLASESLYFLEKFRENPGLNRMEIHEIRFKTVNKIFDYFYSNTIIINDYELSDIIRLAKLFKLDRVLENIFKYNKKNLNVENVLKIRDFYLSFDRMDVVENCDKFVENNFQEISKTQTFKKIEFNYLKNVLKSSDLIVQDEKRIFEIVVEWTNVDFRKRQPYGQQLLDDVRFPLMPLEYLHELSDHEIIQTRPLFKKIFESTYYSEKQELRNGQTILNKVDITRRKYKKACSNKEQLNERLICIGGFGNHGKDVISIEISSDFGSTWNKFDENNTGRYEFACCTYKNNIILIGGYRALKMCTNYDPKNKTFTELEPLPDQRGDHVATIIHSELLVLGGYYTKQSLISLNLDKKNGKWRNRKSSSESRYGSTGCSVNDKFYVFGGLKSNSCEYYCPQDDSWRSLPKMKVERSMAGCCYDNNKFIYVVGGRDLRNNILLTSMERFDVEIEQWSTLKSSIGVGRRGLTLTVFKNQIILIGGRNKDDKMIKTIQKYDSISDSWSQIGNLNDARGFHCTVNFKF